MVIVLMTDFGETCFVGQMKGIIETISPSSKIIDLTHSIEKYSIVEAGFTLYNSINFFPDNSIFVCVIDPGVGSNRKSVIIKTDKDIFIGPDNGLFTLILDKCNVKNVIEINNSYLSEDKLSSTFHGRDIFAPIAAKINNGNMINKFGTELEPQNLIRNYSFYPIFQENIMTGNIIFADSFGNLITNIHSSYLNKNNFHIEFLDYRINRLFNTFSDVQIGELVAYIGSSSYLELALNQANLKSKLYSTNQQFNSKWDNLIVKIVYN